MTNEPTIDEAVTPAPAHTGSVMTSTRIDAALKPGFDAMKAKGWDYRAWLEGLIRAWLVDHPEAGA